jgi:hypothetical protein
VNCREWDDAVIFYSCGAVIAIKSLAISCHHATGQVGMTSIETAKVVEEINFKSNSRTARKDYFTEGWFSF